ncbi:thymidylate synthase [Candidatus Methylacidithermus pantelleriae]|uniref:Thymidylate synthase n=1 Tax=Candidatus Methylacidithermus pantelleriae TaxID=2744239 RepID=A0A8J2BKY3_9BACT|nr:thymidylate synthase [Candidatus Methylacidithermus pantelleriae]CAF0701176.1 thymidylate synthase [Candidatus Methylacidithermus pantelleriae]
MEIYCRALERLLTQGKRKPDRTGVGTYALFGEQFRFRLREGFPLLTTKRIHWKSVVHELLWFLRGDTHIGYLHQHGVTIWDEWADPEGSLGRIYGAQWRRWRGPDGQVVDQIAELVHGIRTDPYSRRLLVTAWNPAELHLMALPPCHVLFQVCVLDGELSLQVYQRSADFFLGVPFNIASYALLTHLLAHIGGFVPGELVYTLGDYHLYLNHIEPARILLSRKPRPLPRLEISPDVRELEEVRFEHFRLVGYDPHPPIPAPVAV